jgi:hypothetical protein
MFLSILRIQHCHALSALILSIPALQSQMILHPLSSNKWTTLKDAFNHHHGAFDPRVKIEICKVHFLSAVATPFLSVPAGEPLVISHIAVLMWSKGATVGAFFLNDLFFVLASSIDVLFIVSHVGGHLAIGTVRTGDQNCLHYWPQLSTLLCDLSKHIFGAFVRALSTHLFQTALTNQVLADAAVHHTWMSDQVQADRANKLRGQCLTLGQHEIQPTCLALTAFIEWWFREKLLLLCPPHGLYPADQVLVL